MANIGRMSVSYFVRFDITTKDPAAFLRYFRDVHVPLVTRWPGLREVVLHTPIEWNDPYAITRGKSMLLVQFEFDSAAALNQALFSPERAKARLDFQNFPAFAGTVTHQALATEAVWTKE
jgi:uncharacterized protein (TIGR02118 family)